MYHMVSKEMEAGAAAAAEKIVRNGKNMHELAGWDAEYLAPAENLLTGAILFILEARASHMDLVFDEMTGFITLSKDAMQSTLDLSVPEKAKSRKRIKKFFECTDDKAEEIKKALCMDLALMKNALEQQ